MQLRELLLQALEVSHDDEQLAAHLIASGAVDQVMSLATISPEEAAQVLGCQTDSIRKMMWKAAAFPRPVVNGRRFSRAEITEYDQGFARHRP